MDRNILAHATSRANPKVALRKESVDRNISALESYNIIVKSLSARRAWIEIFSVREVFANFEGRSPQGERG